VCFIYMYIIRIFFFFLQRFNVALTRAKALMIIIGNPNILCTNEHWKVLCEYCKKHKGYVPFEQMPLKEDIIAKLEGKKPSKANSCNDSDTSNTTKLYAKLGKEERETKILVDVLVSKMESLILKQTQ